MGLFSSIASAVGNVAGGILGGNSANAKAKRQWQREVSWEQQKMQNAHQWEMEDLKKAGLNPTLSLSGSGAVGSGSPTADTSKVGNFGNFGTDAIQNYNTIEQLNKDKELAETQGFKNFMDGLKSGAEADAVPTRVQNETRDTLTRMSQQKAEEQRINAEINERTTQSALNVAYTAAQDIENEFQSGDFAKAMRHVDKVIDTLKNAGGAATSMLQPYMMIKGAKGAKEALEMMKSFKKSGVFDIMKNYAKGRKR